MASIFGVFMPNDDPHVLNRLLSLPFFTLYVSHVLIAINEHNPQMSYKKSSLLTEDKQD